MSVCTGYEPRGGERVQGGLYNAETVINEPMVYLVARRREVDTFNQYGLPSVSPPEELTEDWQDSYTDFFKGRNVVIIYDNDEQGRGYIFSFKVSNEIGNVARSTKTLGIEEIWPEAPVNSDISTFFGRFGQDGIKILSDCVAKAEAYVPEPNTLPGHPLFSCFKPISEFEEQDAEWLVPDWIPVGQITLLSADGGAGKTSTACNIMANLSAGKPCILDPPGYEREPQRILLMTTEDSISKKIKRKLRIAGANEKNIIALDISADKSGILRGIKFGTKTMDDVIRHYMPALCVFDPVQGFIPPEINMGNRNAMRDCMAPLVGLGEDIKVASLIVSHTNKRKGAYGRDRIADSADLWDIARSVLMEGYTDEQGIRYLSNEKNNYAQLRDTLLFSIDNEGQVKPEGTTWKRDREFMQEAATARTAPKREDCKEFILRTLEESGGSMKVKDLEQKAGVDGYSSMTLRRAKDELKESGEIHYFSTGSAKKGDRIWHVARVSESEFTELPKDTALPFDMN